MTRKQPKTEFVGIRMPPVVRQFLEKVSRTFNVTGTLLYGSYARGDFHDESDVDVAVFLDRESRGQGLLRTAWAMDDAAIDVLLETGVYISPLPIWEREWEHAEDYST